ncbi:MAG: hypothetical protein NDI88_12415 [Lysobacter sp.]|nr:hypothetical protein [Lysobacter sp.]
MSRLHRTLALCACLAGASAVTGALAGSPEDYANAWLGERLWRDRPKGSWTDLVARPVAPVSPAASGPRTWNPSEQNPWANTYGTPAEAPPRAARLRPGARYAIPVCTCYLPADARSWDGGPLTDADIARLCRAQCF